MPVGVAEAMVELNGHPQMAGFLIVCWLFAACGTKTMGRAAPSDDSSTGDDVDAASAPPIYTDARVAADQGTPPDDASAAGDIAASTPDAPPATPPAPGACAKLFGGGAVTDWARYDDSGKLTYKPLDARGDRIMDFSNSGYMGGGVALPNVPTVMTIGPSGGDDSAAIQAGLDAVSQRPLVNGVRGALLLEPGMYTTTRTLNITASGVVLRGSGTGANGTIIDLTNLSHVFLDIHGAGKRTVSGPVTRITDSYVPSGARNFAVNDASTFKVGDTVLIGRPVTAAWIHFMGMDTLVRNGAPETWIAAGTVQYWERTIAALAGNKVTLDIPISDSLDAQYVNPPGASMQKVTIEGRISQVGVETLKVTAPVRTAAQASEPGTGGSQFLNMSNTVDSWIKGVESHNPVEGIHINGGSLRITVEDCVVSHDATDYTTLASPFDYSVSGSQVLVHRSSSTGGNKIFYYSTQAALGPNVVLNFTGKGHAAIQPHQRWSTGLLVDNAVVDEPLGGVESGIAIMNRGAAGSGHGWSEGWAIAWNCTSANFLIQKPPGSMNWGIGCKGALTAPVSAPGVPGAPLPNGLFESANMPVGPKSLYLAQLCERLGPQALANIGYR
jgi:hypothetical protein